ncbi:hypothetical protein BGZ61DRAFT_376127 [Ilyonectria robusta]|uniref:uncharacterized protein n=1 Tax=Ilyonectria robusta TaxID=1079257 RepID=UPI001E8EA69B|nr:uncharacterized protein BGZ61DRAFT_376127 [Ilyonectria robusta]KAH8649536.1 hypothetical protein BGZ61DRAFT_376127 [Ilyonectria robusta]
MPAAKEARPWRRFDNRSKAGCLLCRERKKKCDEGRPSCSSCVRRHSECTWPEQTQGGSYWDGFSAVSS